MNETWLECTGIPLESNVILLLWSFTVSVCPLGGRTGAVVAGPMAIILGRQESAGFYFKLCSFHWSKRNYEPYSTIPAIVKNHENIFSITDQSAINILAGRNYLIWQYLMSQNPMGNSSFPHITFSSYSDPAEVLQGFQLNSIPQ